MKILFYVEPLIEMGKPYWKEGWLFQCVKMANTLSSSVDDVQYRFIVNEALFEKAIEPYKQYSIEVNQDELLFGFSNYIEASKSWFLETYTEKQLEYYVKLYKGKLNGFSPDLIITYTNVPFLKILFPNSLILYKEYGIFSRSPFPESWFLDRDGVSGGGSGASLDAVINKLPLEMSEEKRGNIERFRESFSDLIFISNPFKEIFSVWKKKFRKLVFVPLQTNGQYSFDQQSSYVNQFDFAYDVLRKVPSDIGVVFCEHPQYPLFNEEIILFLESNFCNFLYSKKFGEYDSPGQVIISECDAVLTVSSSLGLHSLFWKIPLISIGKNFLRSMSDGTQIEDIENVIYKRTKDKDHILYFLITKYSIPDFLIHDSDWLPSYLKKRIELKDRSILDSYPVLAEDDFLFNRLGEIICKANFPLKAGSLPLFRQVELLKEDAYLKEQEICNLKEALDEVRLNLNAVYSSRSWRITAPLRWILSQIKVLLNCNR